MSEGAGQIAATLVLKKMIDQSRDLMGVIGEDGKLMQINGASKLILGYQPEELEGKPFFDVVYEEDQFISRTAINEAIKTNKKAHIINRLVHKDKKIVFLDWTMHWDKEESRIYAVGKVLSHLNETTGLAKTEKELLRVHKRLSDYKFALDESTIVSVTDADGTITHANDYFCLLSKYSREELIGQSHSIVNSNYHPRAFFQNLWTTILNGQVWRGTIRNRAKDGSTYWVDNTIVPFLDENGRPYQFMAVRIDISEQKRAEESILMKGKLLSATAQIVSTLFQYEDWEEALNRSFEIVGSATFADKISYFEKHFDSQTGKQLLRQRYLWTTDNGLSRPETSSTDFSLEELRGYEEQIRKNNSVLINANELEDSRIKDMAKAEGLQTFVLLPISIKKRLYGLLGVGSCSTQRQWKDDEISFLHTMVSKLASAIEKRHGIIELQRALEEKNTILESIGDGFIALNNDSTVSYCNNRAEQILCVRREEIIGRKFWEIFSDKLPSSIPFNCQKAMEEKVMLHFEEYFPVLTAWLDITMNPSPHGLSMFFKDVTERKTQEEKLKKINRELALSNSELEQFAFVASHDLQEPLRMITSFLAQIEKKYQDILDEKGKKYIYFARDGAKRMRHIILDLLEFSRVGRSDEDKENVDVGSLLEEIMTLNHKVIKEKGALIKWDEGNFPVVYTFKSPLRLVFQNLIGNGLKYQNDGTVPRINITFDESDETEWHFIVSDNGIGIEREYFEKIFVIFQRLHYKNEFSGTGVGLAICKKIIENLGGKIWVVSEFGKGSDFHFSLPKTAGN